MMSIETVQATQKPVHVEIRDGVCRLTLNRPEMRNALGPDMIAALHESVRSAATDPEVRVIAILAAGQTFSAGGNLKSVNDRVSSPPDANGNDPIAASNRRYGQFLETVSSCSKITVVAAQGSAMGGGAGLVCAADISIGVRSARFGFPETSIGLPPAQILPFVAGRIGLQNARRMTLLAERIDGAEAHRIGLLDYVVEDVSALADKLEAVLASACSAAPGATIETKRMLREVNGLREWYEQGVPAYLDNASQVLAVQMRTEAVEGVAASRDKRPPRWALRPAT